MGWLSHTNWHDVFVPQAPIPEIVVRGTIVYLALFTLLRVVLRRQRGGFGVTDLLVLVLIADAAQNAMAGEYRSLPDGILLVAVIIGWAALLDRLRYRFRFLERLMRPRPLVLVQDGRINERNAAKESVSREELLSQLRLQGVESLDQVATAQMEADGQISVIRRDGAEPGRQPGAPVF